MLSEFARRKGMGNELVSACLEYLRLKGIFAYRNNTGALPINRGGGVRGFIRFGAAGSPDIIAVIKGQYVGIECKMGAGRQSEAQKGFQGELERAGGKYILVRSIDDLMVVIK